MRITETSLLLGITVVLSALVSAVPIHQYRCETCGAGKEISQEGPNDKRFFRDDAATTSDHSFGETNPMDEFEGGKIPFKLGGGGKNPFDQFEGGKNPFEQLEGGDNPFEKFGGFGRSEESD